MKTEQTLKLALTAAVLGAAGAHAATVTIPLPASSSSQQEVALPGGESIIFNNSGGSFAELVASASSGSVGLGSIPLVSAGTTIGPGLTYTSETTIDKTFAGTTVVSNVGNDLLLPFDIVTTNGTPSTDYGYVTFDASENADKSFTYSLDSVTYDLSGAAVTTSAVPEPSSLALLAAGALGLAAYRRRQRATRA